MSAFRKCAFSAIARAIAAAVFPDPNPPQKQGYVDLLEAKAF
jgi:hypothetical protein